MKRRRRRADRLGRSRWAPAAPPSAPAQGRRTAANLRELGVNVDLAPVLDVGRPGGVIAETERELRRHRRAGRGDRDPVRARRCRRAASPRPASTSRASARRAKTPTSRSNGSTSRSASCGAVDEAPYAAFAAAGGELVMLSTAIYPAFSERPAAFTRAIATGELRDRLGFEGVSITDALETVAVEHFGGTAEGRASPAARAGADLLLFARLGPARSRPGGRWSAKLRAGALDRRGVRAGGAAGARPARRAARARRLARGRVVAHRDAGRRCGPRRGPRPWPRTSPCRPRRRRRRRWCAGRRRTSRRRC